MYGLNDIYAKYTCINKDGINMYFKLTYWLKTTTGTRQGCMFVRVLSQ